MLQTALGLLHNENHGVRYVFSSLPHKAFQGSSIELIGQIVDRILTINAAGEDEAVKDTYIMIKQSLGKNFTHILVIDSNLQAQNWCGGARFKQSKVSH